MKRIFSQLILAFLFLPGFTQTPINDYSFKFTITGLPDSLDSAAYMANYYGSKQYYFDTVTFSKGGILTFSGSEIKGGIYSIILSDKKSYFEFVVNEPKIEMETRMGDFTNSMKVKTSEENKQFYTYLNFIESKAKEAEVLKKSLEEASEENKAAIQDKLNAVDKEVIQYKKNFIATHPTLFVSKVFQASAEPEIPEFSEIEDPDKKQQARYRAFKTGYLSGVDFTDERLLRTPVLHNKLNYYITKLVPQIADSLIKEADIICEKAKPNQEVYKYVVHTITSKYEDSKIMGLDAVMVHMGQKYYCNGQAYWMSEKKLKEFCDRIDHMAPLLIGNYAIDLILPDTNLVWHRLYDVDAKFTVLYFWASDCGHCKKVTPKLKEFYDLYHQKGIEVYAVETNLDDKEWKKYLKNHDMPWINVSDNKEINTNAHDYILKNITTLESLNFRDTYDIFSTPKIYLLDQNKKIIASKLMPEQLGEFINHWIESEVKKAAEKSSP